WPNSTRPKPKRELWLPNLNRNTAPAKRPRRKAGTLGTRTRAVTGWLARRSRRPETVFKILAPSRLCVLALKVFHPVSPEIRHRPKTFEGFGPPTSHDWMKGHYIMKKSFFIGV